MKKKFYFPENLMYSTTALFSFKRARIGYYILYPIWILFKKQTWLSSSRFYRFHRGMFYICRQRSLR